MRPTDLPVDVGGFEARRSAREEFAAARAALVAEFAGAIAPGAVIRQLAIAQEQLLADGVRSGLAVAAESMARLRLSALVPAHSSCS